MRKAGITYMELLRIGDNKLKVTLSGEDMEHYRLDSESMDYDTTETRSAFWQILDEAKQKTGFDAGGGRIFVQVYSSRAGGCEMYITLVSEEGEGRGEAEAPRPSEGIYCFDTLPTLLAVCRMLDTLGYRDESTAYTADGAYYLVIREARRTGVYGSRPLGEYAFLEEYGTRLSGGVRRSYLDEHGRCLCDKGAVSLFSSLA